MKERKKKTSRRLYRKSNTNPCEFHMHCRNRNRNRTCCRLCPEWMTRSGWCNRKPPPGCCVLGATVRVHHLTWDWDQVQKRKTLLIRGWKPLITKTKACQFARLYPYRSKRNIKDKEKHVGKTKDNGWVLLVRVYIWDIRVISVMRQLKLDSVGIDDRSTS